MKKKHFFISLILLFFGANSFAQQDGYWDKDRSMVKEIVASARDRIIVKSEDLPVGTTEIVYRITVLDQNQQLANSLISLLKAIPDPTGISQGSAGAVFLLSKVSGDDRCKYAAFTSNALALAYKENGKTDKACLYQNNPVNKDAKTLSVDKSTCIQSNTTNLWFGFESQNWIMNQKIILEIVPWVDVKLSRGWNLQNRKTVLGQCKSTEAAKKLQSADEYCICMLDKLQKEFKFQEFQQLMAIEKAKKFKTHDNTCLIESGAENSLNDNKRIEASNWAKKGKYGEAITTLIPLINSGKATVYDYDAIGTYYIYTKQYDKAIKFLKTGEILDDAELLLKLNLAHAYLLSDNYKEAKSIYKKYELQNVTDSLSWKEKIKLDFEAFQKAGLSSDDFKKVLRIID